MLAGCLALLGHFHHASAATNDPGPIVVIDSSWSADYAKDGCQTIKAMKESHNLSSDEIPRYTACVQHLSPEADARNFEDRLMTQVAVNPSCKGLTVGRYDGPQKVSAAVDAAMEKPHWNLKVRYTLGVAEQSWELDALPFDTYPIHTEGEGSAKKVAADICAIVLGHGGRLRP